MSRGAVPPLPSSPKLIVGIGASAGGLRALTTLFGQLPAHTGCAFVVIQHLAPDTESLLDDLLATQTPMTVRRAKNAGPLEADAVYVIPPNRLMTISGGQFLLTERPSHQGSDHSVDLFFKSLSAEAGLRAIAVILSGNGADGTEGALAVQREGGLVLAQSPGTAECPSMPESAIASGAVDQVLDPAAMAAVIVARSAQPTNTARDHTSYERIFGLLRAELGIDFGHYKPPTIERRVARRMLARRVATVEAYAELLGTDAAERTQIGNDLLIGVTEFFRDPAAFAMLGAEVLRPFLREEDRRELRVWAVGCATGEEVYSLAILINELARAGAFTGQISIFATDVHRGALQEAAAGVYPPGRLGNVSEERLDRFFRREPDGRFRIVPEIRQRIVFAPHSVANDPPFTRMDLISCRNLLIYFDTAMQARVGALFHYALRPGGVLFLGSSESLGLLESGFAVIDGKQKIYRKIDDGRLTAHLPPVPELRGGTVAGGPPPPVTAPAVSIQRQLLGAYDQLFTRHLPAGLIVAADFSVLHYLGPVARHLLPSAGRATDHLLDRVDSELRLALSTAVPRAAASLDPIRLHGVRIRGERGESVLDVIAQSLPDETANPPLVHLSFIETGQDADAQAPGLPASEPFSVVGSLNERNLHLEFEIQTLRQRLQTVIEELQASNEELRSTNEELISSNEELQSTNEELHSVNEELNTVNAGLAQKSEELQHTADDLSNVLASTEVGTVFLDRELRIRKFNPAIGRVFNLQLGDIGRPLEHIAYQLDGQQAMLAAVQAVLATGQTVEREVRMRDGRWLLKRILPFYANDRSVQGVVLTFTDIAATKAMQGRFDLAIEASGLVWWDWDIVADRFTMHSVGPCMLGLEFGALPPSAETWHALVYPADLPLVRRTLEACLAGATSRWECEFRFKHRTGGWLWVACIGRITERGPEGRALAMVGTTHDIDKLKRGGDALARDAAFLAHVEDAIICFDADENYTYWNKGAELLFGWSLAELTGRTAAGPLARSDRSRFGQILRAALNGENFTGELECPRRDGSHVWVDARVYAMHKDDRQVTGCMVVARDITRRRRETEQHARIEQELQQSKKMETLGTLAGGIAHDFNNLLLMILGYTEAITEMLPADDPVLAKLAHVRRAGQRAAALVQRILTFSRRRNQPRQPVVLAQLVAESLPLLRAGLYPSIEIQTNIATEQRLVLADSTQLHQVLLNLYANASHAMDRKTGRLIVNVSAITLTTPPTVVVGKVRAANYLVISIADNGTGMTPETAARAFEPFFTTKRVGDGSGLGLSIVHGIIVSHGGAVQLTTSPGKGTVISILLPELVGTEPVAHAPGLPPRHGRGERVVVIDDEESIASLTRHALEQRGFHATAFTLTTEFLEHFAEHADEVDVVVTDEAMPTMTGSALTGHLRSKGHATPVLIVSGFARSLSAAGLLKLAPADFLGKPFTFDQLAHAVSHLIDRSKQREAPNIMPSVE